MTSTHRLITIWLICFAVQPTAAVQLSQGGIGEVLIYPHYTVNNNLNTLYSVVNTADQPIAAKVNFVEGQNNAEVLSFNIYLAAYDVWTGALIATESTTAGHAGENSVLHLTGDQSCAPFLNLSGQEFLPFMIDLDGNNNDMERTRDGHIEVLEMGVVTGIAAEHISHGSDGRPTNCAGIAAAWSLSGEWLLTDLADPIGALMGSASLVNVEEGLSFAFDALALSDFWGGAGLHTEPGSELPDLSSAAPFSRVMLDDGTLAESTWDHGYQAVSAVFMQQSIMNEYALDSFINGKTEWVVTFPTKHHHTNEVLFDQIHPFTQPWNGLVACEEFEINIWDREQQEEILTVGGVGGIPRPRAPTICHTSNVLEFILPDGIVTARSQILGSVNHITVTTPYNATTESGWAMVNFPDAAYRLIPDQGTGFLGLPVTGFSVQQFTNAGAGAGLLAQYGSLFKHQGRLEAVTP